MIIKIGNKNWELEQLRIMYENDFDTKKAWCVALGHKGGSHFKDLIKKCGFKEEDFGKNRKNIYNQKIKKGDIFGFLKVLEPNCAQDKYGRYQSLCECSCGNKIIVLNNSLKTGNTTSCGHLSGHNIDNQIKNGQIFDYLTVIDANNYYTGANKKLSSKCLCKCGAEVIVQNCSLRSGNTTSCGCKNGNDGNNKIKNGEVFGWLTVIDANGYHKQDNSQKLSSKCLCRCKKEIIVRNGDLRSGKTTSCGCRKISIGEEKIQILLENKNIQYHPQYTFPDLTGKGGWKLSFDFAIFNKEKVVALIEYQGQQHYMPIEFFGGQEQFENQQYNDERKRQYCQQHNIQLIEIPYYDIQNIDSYLSTIKNWEEIV